MTDAIVIVGIAAACVAIVIATTKDHAMTTRQLLNLIEVVDKLHPEGEPVTVSDLDLETSDVPDAVELHRTAVRLRHALDAIESALGVQLAALLGDGGAVRYGDTFFRYHRGWKETVNDPGAFWEMVRTFDAKGDLRIEDLFNPDYVKKTPLPAAIRDTAFTKRRDDDPRLTAVPYDRAPKFLQALEDGDYTLGRKA